MDDIDLHGHPTTDTFPSPQGGSSPPLGFCTCSTPDSSPVHGTHLPLSSVNAAIFCFSGRNIENRTYLGRSSSEIVSLMIMSYL